MIVWGHDPGPECYGNCWLKVNGKRIEILEIGMNTLTLSNLTETPQLPPKSKRKKKTPDYRIPAFLDQLKLFKKYVFKGLKKSPDLVATERYMTRGIKGKSIECVSMMNGILASTVTAKGVTFILYSAASWKNSINRIVDLKELYKECQKQLKPHEIDASFIALSSYMKYNAIKWQDPMCKRLVIALANKLRAHEKL